MPRFFVDTGSPRAAHLSLGKLLLFSGVEKPLHSGLIPKTKIKIKIKIPRHFPRILSSKFLLANIFD
jgi:hypothetical protein